MYRNVVQRQFFKYCRFFFHWLSHTAEVWCAYFAVRDVAAAQLEVLHGAGPLPLGALRWESQQTQLPIRHWHSLHVLRKSTTLSSHMGINWPDTFPQGWVAVHANFRSNQRCHVRESTFIGQDRPNQHCRYGLDWMLVFFHSIRFFSCRCLYLKSISFLFLKSEVHAEPGRR